MSKTTKFLSICMDIMKEEEKLKIQQNDKVFGLDEFYQNILWLEGLSNHQGYFFTPEPQTSEKGIADIQVSDDQGKGILAQIKFFPLINGEDGDNYNRVNGKINMIRKITDETGKLHTNLPVGEYYVEISKGSEYEINETKLTIKENQTSVLSETLIPIINLKEMGWYSGDLHHHSIYSSPVFGGTDPVVESPREVSKSMMAMGASFGALSDHHNTLNHGDWKKLESEDFTPILSKEISTSNGHVMSLGVDEDIIYNIPRGGDRTDDYLRQEFIRITDRIKELGGLPQINHPKDHSKSISWNPEFNDLLPIFQTMEIWNGSHPMMEGSTNYKAFSLWRDLLERGQFIPATTGSDTHNILANDYHVLFDKLTWLAKLIKDQKIEIPDELNKEISFFMNINEELMPILEKWAESNLSSAGVRTFVHVDGKVTQEKILEGLKNGHSFLTNGPILLAEINNKKLGERVTGDLDMVDIELKIVANRPLKTLCIYTSGNQKKSISLETVNMINGKYDYSRTLLSVPVKDIKWIFFQVEDDCTNMAITNPIFFDSL